MTCLFVESYTVKGDMTTVLLNKEDLFIVIWLQLEDGVGMTLCCID